MCAPGDDPTALEHHLANFDQSIVFSLQGWAVVFPGVERPETSLGRLQKVQEFVAAWPGRVGKLVAHLLLKADRIRAVEADIEALRDAHDAEVWFADYSMPLKLVGTIDETEADFLSNDTANNLGFMRMYWDDGQLWREYWDFVFTGSKDIQASLQIQECLLAQIAAHRKEQKLPPLRQLKVWADNANDFKGGDMWAQ